MNEKFLKMAIKESMLSVENGSSPFGAVIVKNNKVVSKAHNTVVPDNDATAHAEVNAIRQAEAFVLTGVIAEMETQMESYTETRKTHANTEVSADAEQNRNTEEAAPKG